MDPRMRESLIAAMLESYRRELESLDDSELKAHSDMQDIMARMTPQEWIAALEEGTASG